MKSAGQFQQDAENSVLILVRYSHALHACSALFSHSSERSSLRGVLHHTGIEVLHMEKDAQGADLLRSFEGVLLAPSEGNVGAGPAGGHLEQAFQNAAARRFKGGGVSDCRPG